MKRIPLKKGENVKSKYNYIIDGVLGSGATCIVYDAHFEDSHGHKKAVKLKECYPYGVGIERLSNNNLVWPKEDEKASARAKFESSYNILSDMQNEESVKDVAVYTLDMFEANETQYIATIPTVGDSYDKCSNDDIVDIVTTCLALTNAVSKLHKQGHLHMDIKPENFIAYDDQTKKGKNVALFDMDTFLSFDEIKNGTVRCVSYSEEWAAPEVKSRRFNLLCPATDIFSIGVVFFERIMKRMPNCLDSVSYATWDFDERFTPDKVNPKVKRLISDVFHKTISASIKKRYQSAEDLSNALIELLKVINEEIYIISSFPVSTCKFVGRSKELTELHEGIKEKGKVFVSGFGGIGKSELVKKYINQYGKDYDSISFIRYTGSLLDDLKAVRIKGDIESQDRMDVLKGHCDERNLIILDNFDVPTNNKDSGLDLLLELNCSLIVTTRTDFSKIFPKFCFMKIGGLSDDALLSIYEYETSERLSEEDKSELAPLLELGKECTFFFAFLSRLVKVGGYAIKDIAKTVIGGLKNLDDSEEILVAKDNIRVEENIVIGMRALFKFTNLTPFQIEMLYFVRTFSALVLERKALRKSFEQIDKGKTRERMKALNKLIELGLINEDDSIYMNDVLKDVIDAELGLVVHKLDVVDPEHEVIDPVFTGSCFNIELIDKFLEIEFKNEFKEGVKSFSRNSQIRSFCSYLCERIITVFENCNFNDTYSYEYLTTLIFDMVETNETAVRVLQKEKPRRVIEILNKAVEKSETDEIVKIKALMILSIVYSNLSKVSLLDKVKKEHHDAMNLCEETLNHLISLIKNHPANDEMMKWFNSIKINEFGAVTEIIAQNPIEDYTFDFSSFYNEEIDEPFDFNDEIEYKQAISFEKKITDALSTDIEPNSFEEFELISNFSSYAYVSKDLTKFKELADKIYEKIFKNVEITYNNRRRYSEFLAALVVSNLKNDGDFEKPMDDLFNISIDNIADALIPEELSCNMFEVFTDADFWLAIKRLQLKLKEELAFKYEVLYTEKVEEKFFQEGWDTEKLYDFYQKLSDDSIVISEKEDLMPEEKEKYKKISLEYQKKADVALGKKY